MTTAWLLFTLSTGGEIRGQIKASSQ